LSLSRTPTVAPDAKAGGKADHEAARQFVNFSFFKVDSAWRRLSPSERQAGKDAFRAIVEEYGQHILIHPYTLVGMRGDVDFMLWRIAHALEPFQEMTSRLLATGMGQYLTSPYSYLAMTKRSLYVDKHVHEGQEGARLTVIPGQAKYLFVYPFVKTRAWYTLAHDERQKIMDEHIAVGHMYPTVKLNTTYSFGLDDQEFVVAFETDHPAHFLDLVMALRETESSKYTLRDTPIFTCIRGDIAWVLDSLGA
jgi:chlorite dismutase